MTFKNIASCSCGKVYKDNKNKSASEQLEEHIFRCIKKIKGYKEFEKKHRRSHRIAW